MSKVMKRRWSSTLGGSGLPRKDTRPCEYEAYVPDPLVGRRIRYYPAWQARLPHGADERQPLRRPGRRDDGSLRWPRSSCTGGKSDVLVVWGRRPRTGDASRGCRRERRHRLDSLCRQTDDERQLGRDLDHHGCEPEHGAATDEQPEYRDTNPGESPHSAVGRSFVPQDSRIGDSGLASPGEMYLPRPRVKDAEIQK